MCCDGCNGFAIFVFDRNDAFARAGVLHDELQAVNHLRGVVFHQHFVFKEQRLAFRAVGDHGVDARIDLFVGGKTRTAGADNAGLANLLD